MVPWWFCCLAEVTRSDLLDFYKTEYASQVTVKKKCTCTDVH